MSAPSRILLADDHALLRQGLRLIIEREADLTVVAEASDGRQAIEQANQHRPDLAILDVSMPVLNGLGTARELRRQLPALRILMLSMHDNEEFFLEALQAGQTATCSSPPSTTSSSTPAAPRCAATRRSSPEAPVP